MGNTLGMGTHSISGSRIFPEEEGNGDQQVEMRPCLDLTMVLKKAACSPKSARKDMKCVPLTQQGPTLTSTASPAPQNPSESKNMIANASPPETTPFTHPNCLYPELKTLFT